MRKTEIDEAIALIINIKNYSKQYRQQLSQFYVKVINSQVLKVTIIAYSFEELTKLITDTDSDIAFSVLNLLTIIQEREKEKGELLTALVGQDHFNQNLVPGISHIFFNFQQPVNFFSVLNAYAEKWRFKIIG